MDFTLKSVYKYVNYLVNGT